MTDDKTAQLLKMVDLFSKEMKKRILEKTAQGIDGWNDPAFEQIIRDRVLLRAGTVRSEDNLQECADLANYTMFVWNYIKSRE